VVGTYGIEADPLIPRQSMEERKAAHGKEVDTLGGGQWFRGVVKLGFFPPPTAIPGESRGIDPTYIEILLYKAHDRVSKSRSLV
jgi:hypothetical protein